MKVEILHECGIEEAMFGVGLSYGLTSGLSVSDIFEDDQLRGRLLDIAGRLAHRGGGHNKFLRQISVWIDVEAPLYFWQECSTYGVGNTFQSESTMHTIWKRNLNKYDFAEQQITDAALEDLNTLIDIIQDDEPQKHKDECFLKLKRLLPSSFLQRRIMSTNYMSLQNICAQRAHHRLPEWRVFINAVSRGIMYKHWIFKPEAAEC